MLFLSDHRFSAEAWGEARHARSHSVDCQTTFERALHYLRARAMDVNRRHGRLTQKEKLESVLLNLREALEAEKEQGGLRVGISRPRQHLEYYTCIGATFLARLPAIISVSAPCRTRDPPSDSADAPRPRLVSLQEFYYPPPPTRLVELEDRIDTDQNLITWSKHESLDEDDDDKPEPHPLAEVPGLGDCPLSGLRLIVSPKRHRMVCFQELCIVSSSQVTSVIMCLAGVK